MKKFAFKIESDGLNKKRRIITEEVKQEEMVVERNDVSGTIFASHASVDEEMIEVASL